MHGSSVIPACSANIDYFLIMVLADTLITQTFCTLRGSILVGNATNFLWHVMLFSVGVLGQEWEKSEIHSHTPYKAFTGHEVDAEIGIKIGLASVNITLKSKLLKSNLDQQKTF